MSALTGMANSAGRIPTVTPGAAAYFRAMGVNTNGVLTVVVAGFTTGAFNGSVLVRGDGAVYTHLTNPIDHYSSGLPLDSSDNLCCEYAAATRFDQGVGFTASNRVALI